MARRPRKRVPKRPVRGRSTRRARAASAVLPPPPRRLHNLLAQLTTFIGREREITEVKELLGRTRLLTLTGSGGCGKTRLALQVAAQVVEQHRDGVRVAELASITDPALVPKTIATALDVPEQPRRDMADTLVDALRPKELLLVLDNCEHLLTACTDLAVVLLRGCPEVRILATSREPLGLPGERRWSVPPLSVPDSQHPTAVAEAMTYEAVLLFADRAATAHSTFAVTGRNAAAVADLCRQLDGIPLAIEMAAAWVRVLTVEEIVARLSDRFRLLTAPGRAVLRRHQTLKTAMDWSFELLSAEERRLLSRLSVFAGGWSLEAAEAICGGDGIESSAVLGLLANLVDKSLVVAETAGGDTWYRLLETIRQYGAARLDEARETLTVRLRHRDWYVSLAERAHASLHSHDQPAWLERLEIEHDNLRVALEASRTTEDGAVAMLRLAAALHEFWFIVGHYTEGRQWLEAALRTGALPESTTKAQTLLGAGMLLWRQSDPAGRRYLREALTLFRQLEDRRGVAYALHHLAHATEDEANFERAVEMFERSVAIFREAEDRWGVGWSLYCLGSALLRTDDQRAAALLTEGLAICREVGNRFTTAYALAGLGAVAANKRDYRRASALIEEGLVIGRQIKSKNYISSALCGLGDVSLRQRDYERAAALSRESLVYLRELGNKRGAADALRGLAAALGGMGDHERAARLFGAADAVSEGNGFFWPTDTVGHARQIAAARNALGQVRFASAWDEGRLMSLEAAIAEALVPRDVDERKGRDAAAPSAVKRPGLLAPREQEVARLIAEGKTNREIAGLLAITEGTAEAHVQHILNKLGMNTRAQIAAWMVTHRTESPNP